MRYVRVENFEGVENFVQFQILPYLENFAGINSISCDEPPTKNAKLKTPRNFLPVRYVDYCSDILQNIYY